MNSLNTSEDARLTNLPNPRSKPDGEERTFYSTRMNTELRIVCVVSLFDTTSPLASTTLATAHSVGVLTFCPPASIDPFSILRSGLFAATSLNPVTRRILDR